MILAQDATTGHWNRFGNGHALRSHAPEQCEGRLCDVHNRRGESEQSTWPLNWRNDRAIMEVICPHGIGHPSEAQLEFWLALVEQDKITYTWASGQAIHGCDGCCYQPTRKEEE